MKIIGGYRELSGEEFGIFIKRVLPGGIAAQDGMSDFNTHSILERKRIEISNLFILFLPGRLKAGDLILDVNNMNLAGVTNERYKFEYIGDD